jgi:hypothetical protein
MVKLECITKNISNLNLKREFLPRTMALRLLFWGGIWPLKA